MAVGAVTAVTLSPGIPDALVVMSDTAHSVPGDGSNGGTCDDRNTGSRKCSSRIAEVTPAVKPGRVGLVAVEVGTTVSLCPMQSRAFMIVIGTDGLDRGDK